MALVLVLAPLMKIMPTLLTGLNTQPMAISDRQPKDMDTHHRLAVTLLKRWLSIRMARRERIIPSN